MTRSVSPIPASRLLVAAAVVALTIVGLPAQSLATVKSYTFSKGLLTVRLEPDSASSSVSCIGGQIELPPLSTTIGCTKLREIVVHGTGRSDLVNLGLADTANFPDLSSATFYGGRGNDYLIPPPDVATTYAAAGGTDRLQSSGITNSTLTATRLTRPGPDVTMDAVERVDLWGSAGDDIMNGSTFPGTVELHGQAGNDTLTGGPGNDLLFGGAGIDTMNGGKGDDAFDRYPASDTDTEGSDTVGGGPGNDEMHVFGLGNLTIGPGAVIGGTNGVDYWTSVESISLTSSGAAPTLDASAFTGSVGLFAMSAGNAVFKAGSGGSVMRGDAGADTYQGGAGIDWVYLFDNPSATLTNTAFTSPLGNDTIASIEKASVSGTTAANVISTAGFSGQVFIQGGGGAGADTITTGPGNDEISGISGGSVSAGGGSDLFTGTFDGTSVLTDSQFQNGFGTVLLTGVDDAELWFWGSTDDTLDASAWSGSLTAWGTDRNETVIGGSGQDFLHGASGNDVLQGRSGDDQLLGGSGNDALTGGLGTDVCVGGKGTNTFATCETKS